MQNRSKKKKYQQACKNHRSVCGWEGQLLLYQRKKTSTHNLHWFPTLQIFNCLEGASSTQHTLSKHCPNTMLILMSCSLNCKHLYFPEHTNPTQKIDLTIKEKKLGQSNRQLIRTLLRASWIMENITVSHKILNAWALVTSNKKSLHINK